MGCEVLFVDLSRRAADRAIGYSGPLSLLVGKPTEIGIVAVEIPIK